MVKFLIAPGSKIVILSTLEGYIRNSQVAQEIEMKEFKFLFEEAEWTWIDDTPTLV